MPQRLENTEEGFGDAVQEDGFAEGARKAFKDPRQFVFICLGLNVFALLMMIPLWNACLMLKDPVFKYFLGDSIPARIFGVCAAILVIYIITIPIFFQKSHEVTHTEQTMLSILVMFIMLFGGITLLIAHPMRGTATEIGTELMINSRFGSKTYDFYRTSLELQSLRSNPDCANLPSVEDCAGFVQTPFTDLLKGMETKYKCVGWGTSLEANDTQAPIDPAGNMIIGLKQATTFSEKVALPSKSSTSGPKTLFSSQEHKSSCDGMVGRSMMYFLEDVSDVLFAEGTYLLVICIAIGFLKLVGSCATQPSAANKKAMEYGALADERPYGNNPAQVGRVFQGILRG